MTEDTALEHLPIDNPDLKSGDWCSATLYYKYKESSDRGTHESYYEDRKGTPIFVSKSIVKESFHSSQQVRKTKKLARTKIIREVLSHVGKDVFTIKFKKKLDNKILLARMEEKKGFMNKAKKEKLKSLKKWLEGGDDREMTATMVRFNGDLGRSTVVDLNIPKGQHNERQIDHRTIQWIIFHGVKYVVP